jgi:DNA-directed RNA polymerase subunit beta'
MKENVICGHLIPAGTGLRQYERLVVCSKDDINDVLVNDDEFASIPAENID